VPWGCPTTFCGRVGLLLLAVIGIGMLIPAIGHALERPFARTPIWRLRRDGNGLVLGLGLGLVFVPCAGPILAAITVLAATGQVDGQLVLLTLSFAAGVAIPLLFFALAGARLGDRIRRNRGRSQTLRKVLGGVLVATSVVLALGIAEPLQRATPEFLADIQERIEDSDAARESLDSLSAAGAAATDAQVPGFAQRCQRAPRERDVVRRLCPRARPAGELRPRPQHPGNREVVQHPGRAAPLAVLTARRGRAGGLLDVLLHQLSADHPPSADASRVLRRRRPDCGGGAHPGVPVREGP
jgi:hypothetical protein